MWEVVSVWRDYAPEREAFYEHFAPYVGREGLDQALAYAERFADEVEGAIRQNERVERLVNRRG